MCYSDSFRLPFTFAFVLLRYDMRDAALADGTAAYSTGSCWASWQSPKYDLSRLWPSQQGTHRRRVGDLEREWALAVVAPPIDVLLR